MATIPGTQLNRLVEEQRVRRDLDTDQTREDGKHKRKPRRNISVASWLTVRQDGSLNRIDWTSTRTSPVRLSKRLFVI